MIDHHYKIITREVARTASCLKHFVAELGNVCIIVEGVSIHIHFSQPGFIGFTRIEAIRLANDAVRHWLMRHDADPII